MKLGNSTLTFDDDFAFVNFQCLLGHPVLKFRLDMTFFNQTE